MRHSRWVVGGLLLVMVCAAGGAAIVLGPTPTRGCEVVFRSPNRPPDFDIAYLKARGGHIRGDLPLDSPLVRQLYQSSDSRNFAVDVLVADFSHVFGVPTTDAQNPFYGRDTSYGDDPQKRVILVFSYGDFRYPLGGFAAQAGPDSVPYHVAMGAVDAMNGSLIFDKDPLCK